jgi:hypothetical protein
MQVSEWGSHLWIPLHCITFNAPIILNSNDKKIYIEYFKILGYLLPCNLCKDSYAYFYKKLKPKYFFNDQQGLTYWLYCIHNLVNAKLNKKSITFKELVMTYEKKRANHNNSLCYKGNKLDENLVNIYVKQTEDKYLELANKIMKKIIKKGDSINWKF